MNNSQDQPSKSTRGPTGSVAPGDSSEDPDDDFRLVAQAQQGDMHAYDTLVTRHRGRIFAMIRNMIHQEADAWDLSQEVFIKAWHALPRFEAKARFSTWLYRIAHNAVYDWCANARSRAWASSTTRFSNASGSTPPRSPRRAAGRPRMHQWCRASCARRSPRRLEKISPEHREVVLLKDVQGLSYKEIAEVMSCELGTVMSRLYYARQKLQTLLKDEYESR
jgi:RNA polymerase sigma-70 factor, ECF subfamily